MTRFALSLAGLASIGLVLLGLLVTVPNADGGWGSGGCSSSFGPVGPTVSQFQSLQSSAPAHVTVKVPVEAQVYFGSAQTTSTGIVRSFVTPPLPFNQAFTYEVRACLPSGLCSIKEVSVQANQDITVTFPELTVTDPVKQPAKSACSCRKGDKCQCPKGKCQCCSGCKECGKDCHCGQDCECEGMAEGNDPCQKCQNNGIDRSRMSPVEKVTVQGREVTTDAAKEIIQASSIWGGSQIPVDGTEPVLTVKADKTVRDQFARDALSDPLKSALVGYRVQLYDTSDPMTSDRTGKPMYARPGVYINTHNGKCLSYTTSYTGSAGLVVALRQAKSVQWDKVPDLTKEQVGPEPGPQPHNSNDVAWPVGVTFLGTLATVGWLLTKK